MQVKSTRWSHARESIRPTPASANPNRENNEPGPTTWVRRAKGERRDKGEQEGGRERERERDDRVIGQMICYMRVQVALAAVWKM